MGKIFLISGVFILREIGLLTEVIGTPLEVSQEMINSSLPWNYETFDELCHISIHKWVSVIILYLLSFDTDRNRLGAYRIVIRVIGSEVESPLAIYSPLKDFASLFVKLRWY